MSVFWVIAGVALLLATWKLAAALMGRTGPQQHLLAVRDLQLDLTSLHTSTLEAPEKEKRQSQLADDFVSSLAASESQAVESPLFVLLLALVIGMSSVFLYLKIGNPGAMTEQSGEQRITRQADSNAAKTKDTPSMEAAVAELQRKLEADPNNPEGWILLGQSYANMRNYQAAISAYEQALTYEPDSPGLMVELAESHLMTATSDHFPTRTSELLHAALRIDPQHDKALWLLGLQAFSEERWLDAASYWEILLPQLPPGNVRDTITEKLADARTQAGLSPVGDTASTAPLIARTVTVKVSIDPNTLAAAAQDDTLFIYAKAATGPAMPLAIKRMKVSDLPLTVVLSDADGMMPQMKLSNFDQVVVVARISKSGSAMTQPGDVTAKSDAIMLDGAVSVDLNLH